MKLNDLVSFVRFSLNGSQDQLMDFLFFFQIHIADRSIKSFHATEVLLIPQTPNFAVSLTLKLELSLNMTYYPRQRFGRNRQ